MKMPKQVPPVQRPELIQPHRTVDVHHGSAADLVRIRMKLLLGANYNDPPVFQAWRVANAGQGGCGGRCGGHCNCACGKSH